MHKLAIALTIFLFALASSGVGAQGSDKVNLTPVIGILAKPSEYDQYPMNDWNYMAASYVKYIESAGARVVPIQWDLPFDNITRIMRSLNGFLLTGGSMEPSLDLEKQSSISSTTSSNSTTKESTILCGEPAWDISLSAALSQDNQVATLTASTRRKASFTSQQICLSSQKAKSTLFSPR